MVFFKIHKKSLLIGISLFAFFVFGLVIIIFVVLLGASQATFFQSVFYALGSGLGYTLLMLMMVTIKPRLELPGLPKAFKGFPIMLITLGLIALTFMGLAGLF